MYWYLEATSIYFCHQLSNLGFPSIIIQIRVYMLVTRRPVTHHKQTENICYILIREGTAIEFSED
jgi:hypothetical protein